MRLELFPHWTFDKQQMVAIKQNYALQREGESPESCLEASLDFTTKMSGQRQQRAGETLCPSFSGAPSGVTSFAGKNRYSSPRLVWEHFRMTPIWSQDMENHDAGERCRENVS